MRFTTWLAIGVVAIVGLAAGDSSRLSTRAWAAAAIPDRAAGSYRFERSGWIYVHLEGPPSQVGFQHGYQLAPEIADLLRVTKAQLLHNTKKVSAK